MGMSRKQCTSVPHWLQGSLLQPPTPCTTYSRQAPMPSAAAQDRTACFDFSINIAPLRLRNHHILWSLPLLHCWLNFLQHFRRDTMIGLGTFGHQDSLILNLKISLPAQLPVSRMAFSDLYFRNLFITYLTASYFLSPNRTCFAPLCIKCDI